MRRGTAEFLIDRLATSIVDESLPLKEVERDLRGTVADIAVRQRGLKKRELASRCGVTEKSVENYLKESRVNPKSPDREIVRILQDQALTLEEVHDLVFPILSPDRNFTLDDAKRAVEKLLRTGEVKELPGKTYRAVRKSAIRCPATPEAHRGLVDQKARDLDYIILRQKQVVADDLQPEKTKRCSRVVGDTNLIRIDFTADVSEEDLPEFYEKLSEQVAKLTMKYEKKKGKKRFRLLLGMREVTTLLLACLLVFLPSSGSVSSNDDSWELDNIDPGAAAEVEQEDPSKDRNDSWELDDADEKAVFGDPRFGAGGEESPHLGLPPVFVRGDTSSDGVLDINDPILLLRHVFLSEPIGCRDAADANDDGWIELADGFEILRFLFISSEPSMLLGNGPGIDETTDSLDCLNGLE